MEEGEGKSGKLKAEIGSPRQELVLFHFLACRLWWAYGLLPLGRCRTVDTVVRGAYSSAMSKMVEVDDAEFPFAAELVTNRRGEIAKVMLKLRDYRALVEAVEDAGLHRAMKRVAGERPLSREAALAALAAKCLPD
jgi:RelB Antitoxin alpha helical domain